MNNNLKKIIFSINNSIDRYQQFIESLGNNPKQRKDKASKIRELLFKKVL